MMIQSWFLSGAHTHEIHEIIDKELYLLSTLIKACKN